MEFNIRKARMDDAKRIKALIQDSEALMTDRLLSTIIRHIDKEDTTAMVMLTDGAITGVWLSREFEQHVSLSFFFIAEKMRRRLELLEFFGECLKLQPIKPILIAAASIKGFEKYVNPVKSNPDVYVFKGLR